MCDNPHSHKPHASFDAAGLPTRWFHMVPISEPLLVFPFNHGRKFKTVNDGEQVANGEIIRSTMVPLARSWEGVERARLDLISLNLPPSLQLSLTLSGRHPRTPAAEVSCCGLTGHAARLIFAGLAKVSQR